MTIDAIGCQIDIAQAIVKNEADYVLALKKNQEYLYEDVKDVFALEFEARAPFHWVEHDHHRTVDKGDGRLEVEFAFNQRVADAKVRRDRAWAKALSP